MGHVSVTFLAAFQIGPASIFTGQRTVCCYCKLRNGLATGICKQFSPAEQVAPGGGTCPRETWGHPSRNAHPSLAGYSLLSFQLSR